VRKVISLALLLTSILGAQAWKQYLLPQPRHFSGIVVDQNGKPIQAVRIDHSGDIRVARQTDTQGKFDFETAVPAVVFRKEGYQSVFVRTDSSVLHVVMSASRVPEFPGCPAGARIDSIDGWGAFFAFPQTQGVSAAPQVRDIDYGARSYSVGKGKGARGIMHGSGPMWNFGMPPDPEIWRSVKYQETTFSRGNVAITASRGEFNNGNRWRYLGKFGESASYSDLEPATADVLDQLLDGACWKSISVQ